MYYAILEKTFHRLAQLEHAQAMLGWDQAVMMPPGGNAARGKAMAELSVMGSEILQDPSLVDVFAAAKQQTDLTDWQRANLREMTLQWQQAVAIPKELVEAQAIASNDCEHAWRSLRPENNWADFEPLLQKVFDLAQESAQALNAALATERGYANDYDALIDLYDPGSSMKRIDPVFDELKTTLPTLLQDILEQQNSRPAPQRSVGPFPIEQQDALARDLMGKLGFDFNAGRLDQTAHPFSGGVPEDARITTRYDVNNVIEGLMGVIHETGHARYEMGRPKDWLSQPVGQAMGMGVHESQSLFFEMQLGRSKPFIEALAPLLRQHLGNDPAFEPDNLHALYTQVKPGLIRVNADEVTYPMHVILRYELERDITLGRATVSDIPERWNDAMQNYLDLDTRGNFKDGPMQDIHWPMGAIGYFPSYTLGAMNAAQLYQSMAKQVPGAADGIGDWSLQPIFDWLSDKVWSQGRFRGVDDWMTNASGEVLNSSYFLNHLKARYLA